MTTKETQNRPNFCAEDVYDQALKANLIKKEKPQQEKTQDTKTVTNRVTDSIKQLPETSKPIKTKSNRDIILTTRPNIIQRILGKLVGISWSKLK